MELNLLKLYKHGDLVKLTVQPEVYGIITLTYDGQYEPECEVFTDTSRVITGLQYIRKVKPTNEKHFSLLKKWNTQMNKVDDRNYEAVYGPPGRVE